MSKTYNPRFALAGFAERIRHSDLLQEMNLEAHLGGREVFTFNQGEAPPPPKGLSYGCRIWRYDGHTLSLSQYVRGQEHLRIALRVKTLTQNLEIKGGSTYV